MNLRLLAKKMNSQNALTAKSGGMTATDEAGRLAASG